MKSILIYWGIKHGPRWDGRSHPSHGGCLLVPLPALHMYVLIGFQAALESNIRRSDSFLQLNRLFRSRQDSAAEKTQGAGELPEAPRASLQM